MSYYLCLFSREECLKIDKKLLLRQSVYVNVLRVRLNNYVTTTTPSITSCCSNGSVKQGAVEQYRLLFYLFVSLWVLPRPQSRTCVTLGRRRISCHEWKVTEEGVLVIHPLQHVHDPYRRQKYTSRVAERVKCYDDAETR